MSDSDHPIFIIGFMASGKTTVGRALSDHLRRPFLDLDTRIEIAAGKAIHEIIRDEGEESFRDIESSELGNAARVPEAIIATGGGVILRKTNRELMATAGTAIWLDTPFDECWRRIELDTTVRPLAPTRAAAQKRWIERRELYAMAGHRIELTGDETAKDVAEIIEKEISREGAKTRRD